MLYGDTSSFNRAISGAGDDESFDLWRKFGAIGRIHNVVKWIMRSDQRRQLFSQAREAGNKGDIAEDDELWMNCDKLLIKDGGVRWNSTYYMLRRARELRPQIDYFQWKYESTPGEAYSPES